MPVGAGPTSVYSSSMACVGVGSLPAPLPPAEPGAVAGRNLAASARLAASILSACCSSCISVSSCRVAHTCGCMHAPHGVVGSACMHVRYAGTATLAYNGNVSIGHDKVHALFAVDLILQVERVLDKRVVGHVLRASLPANQQLASNGVVPCLDLVYRALLALELRRQVTSGVEQGDVCMHTPPLRTL